MNRPGGVKLHRLDETSGEDLLTMIFLDTPNRELNEGFSTKKQGVGNML